MTEEVGSFAYRSRSVVDESEESTLATTLVRTVIEMTAAGKEAVNVLHFAPTTLIPLDLEELATEVFEGYKLVADELNAEIGLLGVQTSYTDGSGLFRVDGNYAGGGSGQMLPPNNAYMIRHAVAGSSRGGRSFLPGVSVSAVFNNGDIATPAITAIGAAWLGFVDYVKTSVTEAPIQVLRTTSGTKVVTSSAVASQVANQRRRLKE